MLQTWLAREQAGPGHKAHTFVSSPTACTPVQQRPPAGRRRRRRRPRCRAPEDRLRGQLFLSPPSDPGSDVVVAQYLVGYSSTTRGGSSTWYASKAYLYGSPPGRVVDLEWVLVDDLG